MPKKEKKTRSKTPTFLLELPLSADAGQARRLRAHFEAARCLYNALLGEATSRLRRMREDPRWQEARAIPRTQKPERSSAFARLRLAYGFSAYSLHIFAKEANLTWIADHLDAVTAQTLATRAYRAANRVCLGQAKRVRFRSRGRGLDSLEGKRNDTGLRFVLQSPQEGNQVVGLDVGPSTIAIVPHTGDARLLLLCEELRLDARRKRRLERKLAAHRKSLHGRLVNEIVCVGNDIRIEKISYKGRQKQFGKSVGLRAPGMLIDHLRRTVAKTGGALHEVPPAHHQTVAVLPRLPHLYQKAALAALAPLCLRSRTGTT